MVSCKHSALCGPTQTDSVPRLGVMGTALLKANLLSLGQEVFCCSTIRK